MCCIREVGMFRVFSDLLEWLPSEHMKILSVYKLSYFPKLEHLYLPAGFEWSLDMNIRSRGSKKKNGKERQFASNNMYTAMTMMANVNNMILADRSKLWNSDGGKFKCRAVSLRNTNILTTVMSSNSEVWNINCVEFLLLRISSFGKFALNAVLQVDLKSGPKTEKIFFP